MSNDRFYRGRKAVEFIENGHKLTSYALSAHSSIVCGSNEYLCDHEGADANGNFTCTVRRGPGKTDYRVRVAPSYAVECPCRHYEELMQRCRRGHKAGVNAGEATAVPGRWWIIGGSERFGTQASLRAGLWLSMRSNSNKKTSFRRGRTPGRAASGISRTSHRSRRPERVPGAE